MALHAPGDGSEAARDRTLARRQAQVHAPAEASPVAEDLPERGAESETRRGASSGLPGRRQGVDPVKYWHNQYLGGAWRHSWPPGKPLPYGVGFYTLPGVTVLSGSKLGVCSQAIGTRQAAGRVSLTYACGCNETGAPSLRLVCPIHGQPVRRAFVLGAEAAKLYYGAPLPRPSPLLAEPGGERNVNLAPSTRRLWEEKARTYSIELLFEPAGRSSRARGPS